MASPDPQFPPIPAASVRTTLWFDGRIDEAAALYVSLIPNSRITGRSEYLPVHDDRPGEEDRAGEALTVDLELDGVPYQLLNGGPTFALSEAVSIAVTVETQEEVDRLWDALTADGGAPSQCGWCKDHFGLSWQIIPRRMLELLAGPHAQAVTAEMFTQTKLDIRRLEAAADAAAGAAADGAAPSRTGRGDTR